MTINPKWIEYNRIHNEGGEGYNPHPKYLGEEPEWSAIMDERDRLQDALAYRLRPGTSEWDAAEANLKAAQAALDIAMEDM